MADNQASVPDAIVVPAQKFKLSDYIFLPKLSTASGKAYWLVILIAFLLPGILVIVKNHYDVDDEVFGFHMALVIWFLYAIYIVVEGLEEIPENRVAGIMLFGKYLCD